ncbi:hypothetical protein [Nocardia sp.]|uniref:hypothetical protein n=1 Tax=Nocardia sp. TaxID=1821 RepID=UPI0025872D6C|nr:hypothetical protein [Nocardia sp.]
MNDRSDDTARPHAVSATRRACSATLLGALDHVLFTAPYVLIKPDNDSVGIARDPHEASAAVRDGPAVTIAAMLRPGILAADIDPDPADEILADVCAEILVRWCVENQLPYLVRESGRPGGRHVLTVAPDPQHDQSWNRLCRSLARRFRVPIDNRTGKALRLLTAPHRAGRTAAVITTTMTPRHVLEARTPHTRVSHPQPTVRRSPGRAVIGPRDQSRSGREYGLACAMARLGYTATQAWNHRGFAAGKSAQRGQLWWRRYLWMPAVTTVAAEQGATAEEAWQRAQTAAPSGCRRLTRDGWQGLWERAVAEARTTRPRRYRVDTPTGTPPDSAINTMRAGLLGAAEASAAVRARRPQQRHSVAAVLYALAPAIVRHQGAVSIRTLALRARLDPKTVQSALTIAINAGLLEVAHTFERGATPSRSYRTGPAAAAYLEQTGQETSTSSCSTPPPLGHCNPERLQRRLNTDRLHWTTQPLPPALPEHSPEAKVLRSYRFQRSWWNTCTPAEQTTHRRRRRRMLRSLDSAELLGWRRWLARREHITRAAEHALAHTATPRDWTVLATAPATLHRGMQHLQCGTHRSPQPPTPTGAATAGECDIAPQTIDGSEIPENALKLGDFERLSQRGRSSYLERPEKVTARQPRSTPTGSFSTPTNQIRSPHGRSCNDGNADTFPDGDPHMTVLGDRRLLTPAPLRSTRVGDLTVTYIPDGHTPLDARKWFPDSTEDFWTDNSDYLTDGSLTASVGGLLVQHRDRATLIDAGFGQPFGLTEVETEFGTLQGGATSTPSPTANASANKPSSGRETGMSRGSW